jgi:transcriptional regulator with XRE-family HTH domain
VEPSFERYCESFGLRVRSLRERRGLTQEDMTDRGFSLRHYQRIEAGRSVTLWTIWKLARAFDVNPRDLLPPKHAAVVRPVSATR